MANAVRGDVRVKLGEREYIVSPTFTVLAEIEDATGLTVLALLRQVGGGMKLRTLAQALHAALTASGAADVPDIDAVGQSIMDAGPVNSIIPLAAILVAILPPKKVTAPAKMTGTKASR